MPDIQAKVPGVSLESAVPEMPTDDMILAYSHGKRVKLIEMIMPKDESDNLPDGETLEVAARLLADMDRVAISRKRMKVEEKTATGQLETTALIASILSSIGGKQTIIANNPDRELPVLPATLPPIEILEGENEVGGREFTFDEFVSQDKFKID